MNTLLTSKAKPISKLIKPTSKTLYISLFSTSTSPSPVPYSSSSSSSPVPYSSSSSSSSSSLHSSWSNRRQEEESRGVRVSVWWDIENCGVPSDVNLFKIAQSITSAVRVNGIKGPVQITAFGDIFCLNRSSQEALSSTGVNLVHIPNGMKNSADRSLLVDLMYWVSQNPPPAHIFLISGDKNFAGILHKLRMSNYNILLAAGETRNTPGVLYSAASIMWYWNELAKGENLCGKHFNQPPDGPLNSWYGHYRGALEDPFAVIEQQKYLEAEASSNAEQSFDTKLRPIPMAVQRPLHRIVNKHPDGVPITELRNQLIKSKVPMDKDFYGHKKFSSFLMALPCIVKLELRPDGHFVARPTSLSAVPESAESDDVPAQAMAVNGRTNCEIPTITRMVDAHEKPSEETNDVSAPAMTMNGGNRTVLLTAKANCETPTITRMVDAHEKPGEESNDVSAPAMTMNGGNRTVLLTAKANFETPTITRMVDAHEKPSEESNDFSASAMTMNGGNRTMLLTGKANRETPTITRMVDVHEKQSQEISEKKEDEKENTVEVKPAERTFEKSTLVGSMIENDMASKKDLNVKEASNEMIAENSLPSEEEGEIKSINEIEVHDPARSSSNAVSDIVVNADAVTESKPKPGFIAKILNWCKFWWKGVATDTPIQLSDMKLTPIKEEPKKSDDAPQAKIVNDDAPQAKIMNNDTPIQLSDMKLTPIKEEPKKSDDAPQAKIVNDDAPQAKIMNDDAPHTRKQELFTRNSFWSALRSFLRTRRGADIVLNSSSREQIAERLKKEGPLFLQPLQAIDMRHLVNLLLTEKKWIEELSTKPPCFRLISPHEERSTPTQPPRSSESRNNPPLRVSSVGHKKPSERTRTEILADCQKLLDDVFPQHPDGYNLSLVKKEFLEKYGYSLDHQKLGYPKLVSLLQIMPGIKVEHSRVFPDNVAYAPEIQSAGLTEKSTRLDSEMSNSAPQKDDDEVVEESPWDELGPIEKPKADKQETKQSLNGVSGEYKVSVIEDNHFSNLVGVMTKKDEKSESKTNEFHGSIMQALGTFHVIKEETNPNAHGLDVDSKDSVESSKLSGSLGVDKNGQTTYAVNKGLKDKATKSYSSVVKGSKEDKKGKLMNAIAGVLK